QIRRLRDPPHVISQSRVAQCKVLEKVRRSLFSELARVRQRSYPGDAFRRARIVCFLGESGKACAPVVGVTLVRITSARNEYAIDVHKCGHGRKANGSQSSGRSPWCEQYKTQ